MDPTIYAAFIYEPYGTKLPPLLSLTREID